MVVKKLLPYGVKDYYPRETSRLKRVLETAEKELSLWGYDEIKLPTIEYKELFETALGKEAVQGLFTTWECAGDDLLALRYDFTPQILRFVLHRREKTYPLRIYYKGETFRRAGDLWEETSFGFELVGTESAEADAEVIAIIKSILEKLGLKDDYTIVVGHRLSHDYLVSNEGEQPVRLKLFSEKLKPYLKLYPLTAFEDLIASVDLPYEVVQDLEKLVELFKSYNLLDKNIVFSPSMEPERDYYSGLFFKVITTKGVIAVGGRYNRLFEKFGEEIPATGAALKIDKLAQILPQEEKQREGYYIIDTTPEKILGWKVAKMLRRRGIRAERDIVARSVEESIAIAREKGYTNIVVIGDKNYKGVINLPSRIDGDNIEQIFDLLGR